VVRSGWDRQGVTAQLPEGTERYAAEHGHRRCRPTRSTRVRGSGQLLAYVGTTGSFDRTGHHRVRETSAKTDTPAQTHSSSDSIDTTFLGY
jgi:hypothetical protein